MSFEEIQFPTDISYGSVGGPEFSTDVVVTHSGYEKRNINWADSRARYNVSHGIKTQDQLDTLIAFFRARKGQAIAFRFKDWTDYKAVAEIIGVGDNTTTQFQLIKAYVSGTATDRRNITKPVAGTISIYVDGVLQTSGVGVDGTTGIITFSTAPATAEIITADFEFDIPVRFDTDRLSASIDSFGTHSWQNIPLIEVKV